MPWTRRRFMKVGLGAAGAGLYYLRACRYPEADRYAGVVHLSPRTAAICAAVVEAVLPPSAPLDDALVEAHVRAIDAQLGSFAADQVTDLNRLLYLVEQATLPLGGKLRRFSDQGPEERAAYLEGFATSSHDLLRVGLRGLVSVVFLAYYRDASAFAGAGYPGPVLPGGGVGGTYGGLLAPAGALP